MVKGSQVAIIEWVNVQKVVKDDTTPSNMGSKKNEYTLTVNCGGVGL